MSGKGFEFLEHTADAYIAAHGRTLEEAFENAALAMFEIMTDTRDVRRSHIDILRVESEDELGLLFSWLEALLLKFEIDNNLYSEFKVDSIKSCPKGYLLEAKAWGEPFNPERHPSRTGVKAVTYHQMEIARNENGVTVKFILDI